MPRKGEKLSPAHKQKLLDAQAKARALKANNHTVEAVERALPAGDDRKEALKELHEGLHKATETLYDQTQAVPIDPSKLDVRNVDNEIAQNWDARRGDIPISKPRPGYGYAWVTHEDAYPSNSPARTSIRAMHATLDREGWRSAEGDPRTDPNADPEGVEFIGKGHCSGTTQRGVGDTVLKLCPPAVKERLEERAKRASLRDMGIEKALTEDIIRATRGAIIPYDITSPRMAKLLGIDKMQPITYSAGFSQEQIRAGTGPLKPGFELRRG